MLLQVHYHKLSQLLFWLAWVVLAMTNPGVCWTTLSREVTWLEATETRHSAHEAVTWRMAVIFWRSVFSPEYGRPHVAAKTVPFRSVYLLFWFELYRFSRFLIFQLLALFYSLFDTFFVLRLCPNHIFPLAKYVYYVPQEFAYLGIILRIFPPYHDWWVLDLHAQGRSCLFSSYCFLFPWYQKSGSATLIDWLIDW